MSESDISERSESGVGNFETVGKAGVGVGYFISVSATLPHNAACKLNTT